MIDGITIIDTGYPLTISGAGISLLSALLVCIALLIYAIADGDHPLITIFSILMSIIAFFGLIRYPNTIYKITEYRVIVDDSVKFNDFMSKYELIEEQGKSYVIRIKEEIP